ncbi:MAG: acyloxyacyl hydrolase [Bacteroidota bacterium]
MSLLRAIGKYLFSSTLSVTLVMASFRAFSQSQKENLSLRVEGNGGVLVPEYQLFNQFAKDYIYGVEISLEKQSSGKRESDQIFNYPAFGGTLLYSTLGNDDVFGQELALYGYFLNHFIRKERFQLNHQFGLGLGYATKRFDLADNFQNVAVGSHLNIHFNYKIGVACKLSEKIRITSGLSFTHYSNANMAEPNLGLNWLSIYLGSYYALGKEIIEPRRELTDFKGSNEFAIVAAAGGKHTRALQSTIYFTSSLSAEYRRHISRKIRLGAGMDLFYDSSTETEMSVPGKPTYKPIHDFRTGIHLSQEIAYDRFSFILQEGIYIGLRNTVDTGRQMYNRGIIRYKINDQLLVHISMKSHLHILDYPEIGFGYWIKRP